MPDFDKAMQAGALEDAAVVLSVLGDTLNVGDDAELLPTVPIAGLRCFNITTSRHAAATVGGGSGVSAV